MSYFDRNLYLPRQIEAEVPKSLSMVVVIPCHNEPDLISSLESIANCSPSGAPFGGPPSDRSPNRGTAITEVITVINSGEQHSDEIVQHNRKTLEEARAWAVEHSNEKLNFHFILVEGMRKKHAGVGLARKIGMDEAALRLSETEKGEGVIVCFDADSKCDDNYLVEIEKAFAENPKAPGASIYYEHPLESDGIILYELYLRYYVQALRWTGYPFAYHTIGSSMAVRSEVYKAVGGMNRKKAGEDFYFLHKLIPRGNFLEINGTRVIPSPRTSDRVPFGTGKAMADYEADPKPDYPVYNFQSFRDLGEFLSKVEGSLYETHLSDLADFLKGCPESVRQYLEISGFEGKMKEIHEHSTTAESFQKRFFAWFDGLTVLQYFHFARDNFHANQPILVATAEYLSTNRLGKKAEGNAKAILNIFRELDRGASMSTG